MTDTLAKSPSSNDSSAAARELLLQEEQYFMDSYWRSEQTGETRVNWFLTVVAAATGGLITLASAEKRLSRETLCVIVLGSLFALLAVGIVTLLRMVKRNAASDHFKRGADAVRQVFRDCFDQEQILLEYTPFPAGEKRRLGGLTHLVAIINALLAGGIVGAAIYMRITDESARRLFASTLGLAAFAIGVLTQTFIIDSEEKKVNCRAKANEPTHAGGIVFRVQDGRVTYLLVQPRLDASEWLFPKGHIEKGEGHGQAALREVQEETGVQGQIVRFVGTSRFEREKIPHRVKFYLIEALVEGEASESRKRCWLELNDAVKQLTYDSSKALLFQAERIRATGRMG